MATLVVLAFKYETGACSVDRCRAHLLGCGCDIDPATALLYQCGLPETLSCTRRER
jgi:hypothetical protein